jgi:prepilin-type N-terminal cleavage/methylation domain-containing protein
MRTRNEQGLSLVEVILAIVILSVVLTAFMATLTTAVDGSRQHRDLVTADATLRDFAETVQSAVRSSCTTAGATWTASLASPSGFTPSTLTATGTCPAVTTISSPITLSVTTPNGTVKSLDIEVRSP